MELELKIILKRVIILEKLKSERAQFFILLSNTVKKGKKYNIKKLFVLKQLFLLEAYEG